jgi:hypothetical protein
MEQKRIDYYRANPDHVFSRTVQELLDKAQELLELKSREEKLKWLFSLQETHPQHAHFICPVRNVTEAQQRDIDEYAQHLMRKGYTVHNPRYATDQDDPTGYKICMDHLESMKKADMIYLFWDVKSMGSHFDLGMAFALGKPMILVELYAPDSENKSYVKVINEVIRRQKEKK